MPARFRVRPASQGRLAKQRQRGRPPERAQAARRVIRRERIESHQVDDFGIFRSAPEMLPVCRTEHPDVIVMKACGDFGYRPVRGVDPSLRKLQLTPQKPFCGGMACEALAIAEKCGASGTIAAGKEFHGAGRSVCASIMARNTQRRS